MRSKTQIEKELLEAKQQLESYERDVKDYDGDSGAERYMFLSSITQTIRGFTQKVSDLENELTEYSKINRTSSSL